MSSPDGVVDPAGKTYGRDRGALPELILNPPLNPVRWLGLRLGLPAGALLVAMDVSGIVNGNSGEVVGVTVSVIFYFLLIAVEVPLILRAQRRKRQKALAEAPTGTWFAAPGYPYNTRNVGALSRPQLQSKRAGALRVGDGGVYFTPAGASTSNESVVPWSAVSTLTVTQFTVSATRLEALVGGHILAWRVTGGRALSEALQAHVAPQTS